MVVLQNTSNKQKHNTFNNVRVTFGIIRVPIVLVVNKIPCNQCARGQLLIDVNFRIRIHVVEKLTTGGPEF